MSLDWPPQFTHNAPVLPHCPLMLPVWQFVPSQHPALHGELPEQVVVQTFPVHD